MKFRTALGVSVALHALLGAGIAVCIALAPKPDVVATLDLSSVDISFSEEDDSSAAAVPPRPEPPPEPPPPPTVPPPPSELSPAPIPLPPDPTAIPVPEPSPEPPKMDAPPRQDRRPERPAAEPQPVAPPPAPRQAKVDAPPKPRRNIRPDYPKGARIRGEQGDVVLEIAVGASGAVERAEVVVSSGYPELDEAAAKAAKAAKFEPAKSGGRAVASVARLTLNFRLK